MTVSLWMCLCDECLVWVIVFIGLILLNSTQLNFIDNIAAQRLDLKTYNYKKTQSKHNYTIQ